MTDTRERHDGYETREVSQELLENVYLARALRDEGVSTSEIAEKFERSIKTVQHWYVAPFAVQMNPDRTYSKVEPLDVFEGILVYNELPKWDSDYRKDYR